MKKLLILPVLALFLGLNLQTVSASTQLCGNPADSTVDPITSEPLVTYVTCIAGGGNPELVVNVWGTTNSQLPHLKPGQTKVLLNGRTETCPFWFPMDCVDITGTAWYQARWK